MVNHSHPTALFHALQPCPLRLLFKIHLLWKVFVLFFCNKHLVKVGNGIHKYIAILSKQFKFMAFIPDIFYKIPNTASNTKRRAENGIFIIVPPKNWLSFLESSW
jgi:hypothetical protein